MDIPIRFLPTQTLAPETFLIRQLGGEGLGPELFALNSMVIRGAEPVIVDTGIALTRTGWMEQVFELVDPEDVRWVFLSHDDSDHTGALREVLDLCPRARLVTNWFTVERTAGDGMLPLDRLLLVNPGESFVAGERTLTAVVPPTFDSPTTRGLFDVSTGVYWAGDSFAMAVPHEVDDAGDVTSEYLRESFLHAQRMVSPWHQWMDPARYQAHLDAVRSLRATVAVGAHGPAFRGAQVEDAFALLAELPDLPAAHLVSQSDLEVLLSLLAAMPAPDLVSA